MEGHTGAVAQELRTAEGPAGGHTEAELGAEVGLYRITERVGARGAAQGMQLAAVAARAAQARAGRACVGLALRLSLRRRYPASRCKRVVRFRGGDRLGGDRAVYHSAVSQVVVEEYPWKVDEEASEEAELAERFVSCQRVAD